MKIEKELKPDDVITLNRLADIDPETTHLPPAITIYLREIYNQIACLNISGSVCTNNKTSWEDYGTQCALKTGVITMQKDERLKVTSVSPEAETVKIELLLTNYELADILENEEINTSDMDEEFMELAKS